MYFSRFLERFALLLIAVGLASHSALAIDITGAAATFPYPIYAKWAEAYKAKTGNNLNYQSIGSGGGIRQIQNKTVDFGASDMPLKPEELDKSGLMQFPTVVGGDVPVVNLPGIKPGEIKLTGPVLADIYLGKIKKWNDSALTSLNPGVKLPEQDITVVHRSDGSGTTFIWVNYLSKVSPEWKERVGEGTSVNWPAGVGGKGNEGVASYVQRIGGAIGYVEYAYALQNKLTHNRLSLPARPGVTLARALAQADLQARAGRSSLAELRSSSLTPSARHSSVSFSSAPSVIGCSSSQARCSVSWKPLFEIGRAHV